MRLGGESTNKNFGKGIFIEWSRKHLYSYARTHEKGISLTRLLDLQQDGSLFEKAKFFLGVGVDMLKGKFGSTSMEVQAALYIENNAEKGNPNSVIATFDKFCYDSHWMMNIGCVFAPRDAAVATYGAHVLHHK